MALALPSDVINRGGIQPELYDYTDGVTKTASLAADVQNAIEDAAAWMDVYMGANYTPNNAAATVGEIRVQTEAQIYLALARLTMTLRAKKTFGSHYPLDSEDGASYNMLIETDWEEMARSLLAKWIAIDIGGAQGVAFALPYFSATNGIDPLLTTNEDQQLREDLDQARGISTPDLATVTL